MALSPIHLSDAKTCSKRAFRAFLGLFEKWILHPPSAKTPFSFSKCSKRAFRALVKVWKARNARFERFFCVERLETRVLSTFFYSKCCFERAFRVFFPFRFDGFAIRGAHLAQEGQSRSNKRPKKKGSPTDGGPREVALRATSLGPWTLARSYHIQRTRANKRLK